LSTVQRSSVGPRFVMSCKFSFHSLFLKFLVGQWTFQAFSWYSCVKCTLCICNILKYLCKVKIFIRFSFY
jgi:hypothetical protein